MKEWLKLTFVFFAGLGVIVLIVGVTYPYHDSELVNVQAQAYVPPKSPQVQTAPAEPQKQQDQNPYYGSAFYEGTITSVYYYPDGPDKDHTQAVTHIKFNHDNEIWLCGDQRSEIKPGPAKRQFILSEEPDAPCVTNWQFIK